MQCNAGSALLCTYTHISTDLESCSHRVAVEVDIHDDASDNGCPSCAIAGTLMTLCVYGICVSFCATLAAATCVK